jgi:hypothetical protein
MRHSPAAVLVDVTGSQVGTQPNPFYISGSLSFPGINIVNNVYTFDVGAPIVVTTPSSSLSASQVHQTLRELVHLDDADGPRGQYWASGLVSDTHNSPFPTASIWWTNSARTQKVVECLVTRNSRRLPVTIQWKAYGVDGLTVVESYTDTITYSGVFEISRTRNQP